jgi:hypothetical protein
MSPAGREIKGLLYPGIAQGGEMMEETVGKLDKDQLTRLAQYFDEKVISAGDYKTHRGEIPHFPE